VDGAYSIYDNIAASVESLSSLQKASFRRKQPFSTSRIRPTTTLLAPSASTISPKQMSGTKDSPKSLHRHLRPTVRCPNPPRWPCSASASPVWVPYAVARP